MTKDQLETARAIVRQEIQSALKQHLYALTAGCLAPIAEAIAQVQENQKLIADGQQLVEKHLAAQVPDDDGEPWRESLDE